MSIKYYNKSGTTPQEILLAGISPVDQILNGTSKNAIANKAVYNALKEKIEKTVSDLVNYYSKTDVYNKAEVRALISTISTMDIQVVNALPTEDISTTTIYFLKPAGATTYDEYVYINNAWVKIGTTDLDLSQYVTNDALTLRLTDYYTKAEITTLLTDYAQKDNVYDKDAVDALLDDKQDSLTFDNVPTENSTNVVKSGGVYSTVDNVYKVMGENGAKNLLKYPYPNSTGTTGGVLFVDNKDGSITVNGTASSAVGFRLALYTSNELEAGRYILSVPQVNNTINIAVNVFSDGTSERTIDQCGKTKASFEFDLDYSDYDYVKVLIWVPAGTIVDNITIKPMLRFASDTDSTYQPYAKTNQQLTEDKAEQIEVNDIVNILGAKNLLPNNATTQTINGVTFTVNSGDGSVTANGTASGGDAQFTLSTGNLIKKGTYILSGCPSGGKEGDTAKYALYLNNNGTIYNDYGDGVVITFASDVSNVTLAFGVANGQTVDGTVGPMLRPANIVNDDYAPYAMTNRELTNQKIDLYGLTSSTAVWQGDTLTFKIIPNNGIMYHLIAMEAARQDTDKGTFCEAYIIMRAQGATAPNIRNRGTDNIIGTWDASSSSLIITLPKTSFWMYRFSVEALHPSARI